MPRPLSRFRVMMARKINLSAYLAALAIAMSGGFANATNVSTADPAYPVAYEDIDSEPLREQFNRLINDIDNIWAAIGPNLLEANQVLGALVSGKATAVSVPSCFGPSDALTWRPGVGYGCNEIEGGDGGNLGPANAFTVLAGPAVNGSPANATFRQLVGNDLPLPTSNSIGGVQSAVAAAHQFMNGISTAGNPLFATPSFTDVSGTLSPTQLPNPTPSSLGGTQSIPVVPHNFVTGISNQGVPTQAQPSFGDVSGNVSVSQMASGVGASASTYWRGDGKWASFAGANPVSGAIAEYPMTEGSGTTIADITGNGNNGTFGSSTAAPAWLDYGIAFNNNVGNAAVVAQYITIPIKTFRTAILNVCPQTYAANGGMFPALFPTPSLMSFLAPGSGATSGLNLSSIIGASGGGHQSFTPGTYWSSTLKTRTATGTRGCQTVAWVLDTNDHIYIDGIEQAYSAQAASSGSVTSNVNYDLGGSPTSANDSLVGTITYGVFYSTALTADQVQRVTSYINNQVSQRPNWPNIPRYSGASGYQLICDGDSLTVGWGGSTSWCSPTYVTPLTNTYNFTVWAWGGEYALDKVGTANMRWLSAVSPGGGRNICSHWSGTNDAIFGTATAVWSTLQQLATADRARGCIPIITTMISRTGEDTQKNALNALIRNGWKQAGFEILDDIAAVPQLGADGAFANTLCFSGDQIHLLGPGTGSCANSTSSYSIVATQLAKIINILDGSTDATPTITSSNAYVESVGDNVVQQTPTASATNTLIDCTGLTSIKRKIVNGSGSFGITVNTSSSQSVVGSNSIPAGGTAEFTCQLIGATTGGNYWLRTQ